MEDVGFEVRWTWVQTPAPPDRQGEQGGTRCNLVKHWLPHCKKTMHLEEVI